MEDKCGYKQHLEVSKEGKDQHFEDGSHLYCSSQEAWNKLHALERSSNRAFMTWDYYNSEGTIDLRTGKISDDS